MDDFDKVFGASANTAKQLEVRWFFYNKDNVPSKKPCHDMPFQRRNLSYIIAARSTCRKRKHTRTSNIVKSKEVMSKKKPDLLFQCFKYRAKQYNPVFLQSPPPKTRARLKQVIIDDEDEPSSKRAPPSEYRGILPTDIPKTNGVSHAVVSVSTGATPPHMSPLSSSEDPPHIHDQITVLRAPTFYSDPTELTDTLKPKMSMIFHFIYHDSKGLPVAVAEGTEEGVIAHRRCPFCYFDGASDSGLLMHCTLCHGEHLSFEAARSEDGTLHICVRRKPGVQDSNGRDFLFYQRGQEVPNIASVPIVQRQPKKAAALDLATRKKKIRLLQEIGAKPSIIQAFVPNDMVPLRQYFHSRTNEPMLDGEWCIDSDDEPDDEWLHNMGDALLDDFVDDDVSPDEKRFLKMWNQFMKSHVLIADFIVPQKCITFIQSHISELVKFNLRRQLVLHLLNLWDVGIIPSTHMVHCLTLFDKLAKTVSTEGTDMDLQDSDKEPPT